MPRKVTLLLGALTVFFGFGCVREPAVSAARVPGKSIKEVLAQHQDELMRVPGVVGVFVGLAEDEKTECIKVLLRTVEPAGAKLIPRTLDGYRVITEVTGEIRPLKQ